MKHLRKICMCIVYLEYLVYGNKGGLPEYILIQQM